MAKIRRPKGESDLARYLIERVESKDGSVPIFAGGSFYRYNCETGIWRVWADHDVLRELQELHTKRVARITARHMTDALLVLQILLRADDFFDKPRLGVACTNGFVSVGTEGVKLIPHAAGHRCRFGYPFAYLLKEQPKEFLGFLDDVFKDDKDKNDKRNALAEFVGACILGIAPQFEQAFLLLGRDGRNGKSVLISCIEKLFPLDSRQSIPPQKWTDQYYLADLRTCRINLVGEIPRGEIMDGADFKAVISGDAVTGRPIRRSPVRFRPIAGHLFAANKLPGIGDTGKAFWRRWNLIEFNRVFAGDVLKEQLIEGISSNMVGLLTWALAGAVRLLRQGAYTVPASSITAKQAWALKADQVKSFLVECTEAKGRTTLLKMYEEYRHWALLNGHSRLSKSTFKDRLIDLGHTPKRGDTSDVYPCGMKSRNEWGGSDNGLLAVV